MQKLVIFLLLIFCILVLGCVAPIAVTEITEKDIEDTVPELINIEAEMEYQGENYLGSFETIPEEHVEQIGSTEDGRAVYEREGGAEGEIWIENAEGDIELWVKEGEEVPDAECFDLSWEINGKCLIGAEDSQVIAEEAIIDSPTYDTAGIKRMPELKEVKKLDCDYCWEYVYSFDAYFPGYGFLDETPMEKYGTYPHTAVVRVEYGETTYLVYDGTWDSLTQRNIS